MEVHIPTLPDATTGIEKGGSLRPRPPVPLRRSRPGGRGATTSWTTTSAAVGMHVRIAISRTTTHVSHVRLQVGMVEGATDPDNRLPSILRATCRPTLESCA